MSGASSVLSFTTFRRPGMPRATRSTIGETIRHGPHHGAQKSTRTGIVAWIAASNVSRSASRIQGSGLWQCPHRGTPSAATGTRLRFPQCSQVTIAAWAVAIGSSRPSGGGGRALGVPGLARAAVAGAARGRALAPRAVDVALLPRARVDLDAVWLGLLGPRDGHRQDTLGDRRVDGVGVQPAGNTQGPLEAAEATLDVAPDALLAVALLLVREAPLAAHGERVV